VYLWIRVYVDPKCYYLLVFFNKNKSMVKKEFFKILGISFALVFLDINLKNLTKERVKVTN